MPLVSTESQDHSLPEHFNLEEEHNMEMHPEESMSLAQAIYENDPIYRPENRAMLEEIVRQGREAARHLDETAEQEEDQDLDELYDWGTSED